MIKEDWRSGIQDIIIKKKEEIVQAQKNESLEYQRIHRAILEGSKRMGAILEEGRDILFPQFRESVEFFKEKDRAELMLGPYSIAVHSIPEKITIEVITDKEKVERVNYNREKKVLVYYLDQQKELDIDRYIGDKIKDMVEAIYKI